MLASVTPIVTGQVDDIKAEALTLYGALVVIAAAIFFIGWAWSRAKGAFRAKIH